MKEGLISIGGRNLSFLSISDSDRRVPAGLGQESQASSCLSNETLLASRVIQRVNHVTFNLLPEHEGGFIVTGWFGALTLNHINTPE